MAQIGPPYAEDFIDNIKFFLPYDSSYSGEVYLYWFESFWQVLMPDRISHNKEWHLSIGKCVTNAYENNVLPKNN